MNNFAAEVTCLLCSLISTQLQQNLPRYVEVLKLQKEFEETCTSPGRYYICGGENKEQEKPEIVKDWENEINSITSWSNKPKIETGKLGLVGKHDVLKNIETEGEKVEADHIPPKCVFKNLHENPFYRVAKWHNDTEHKELTNLLSEKVKETIENFEKIIEDEDQTIKKIKERQIWIMKTTEQKAIEICIVNNKYEKMILKKMKLEADQNSKNKLEDLEKNMCRKESLYDLICKSGDNGACRNVLKSHHEQGLTYGNSTCAQAISAILQRALLSGDGEKLIKWSLMAANPEVSIPIKKVVKEIFSKSKMKINEEKFDENDRIYHHIGDKLLVEYYKNQKFITEPETEKLYKWLERKEAQLKKGNPDVCLEQIKPLLEQLPYDVGSKKKKKDLLEEFLFNVWLKQNEALLEQLLYDVGLEQEKALLEEFLFNVWLKPNEALLEQLLYDVGLEQEKALLEKILFDVCLDPDVAQLCKEILKEIFKEKTKEEEKQALKEAVLDIQIQHWKNAGVSAGNQKRKKITGNHSEEF